MARPRARRASISSIRLSLDEGVVSHVLPVAAEPFTQSVAGAVQTGSHGADRDPQRHRDLFVTQVGPGEQEERVTITRGEAHQGLGDGGSRQPGIQPGVDPAQAVVAVDAAIETRVRAEPARFPAVVVPHQVRRDPKEPWARVPVRGIEPPAPVERRGEGLSGEIVGQVRSDAACEISMDSDVVPVEHAREQRRFDS